MTQATATTVVRAVRQHGGGLVHTQQPRAHARGRQLTPRGGAINRRCEATSIIHSLFPSSAAAAYPLTGVRRARTLSPSLRFNNRPHAQLVVGYAYLTRISRFKEVIYPRDDLPPVYLYREVSVTIWASVRRIAKVAAERAEATQSAQIQIHKYHIFQTGTVERAGRLVMELECFEGGEPVPSVNDDAPNVNQFPRGALNAFHEFSSYSQSDSSSLAPLQLSALRRAQLYIYGQEDCQDRANSLYPRRQIRLSCTAVSQRGTKNPEPSNDPYRPSFPIDAQHHVPPSCDRKHWSLQAPRHYVQRGAA